MDFEKNLTETQRIAYRLLGPNVILKWEHTAPGITRALNQLAKNGHIKRHGPKSNKRNVYWTLK